MELHTGAGVTSIYSMHVFSKSVKKWKIGKLKLD